MEAIALIQLDDTLDGVLVVVLVEDATYHTPYVLYVFLFHCHDLSAVQVAKDADGTDDLLHLVPFGYRLDLEVLVDGDVVEVLRDGDGLLHAMKYLPLRFVVSRLRQT